MMSQLCGVLAAVLMACCAAAQEQYPPPLPHTPANHPAQRVVVIGIDGLHAIELQRFVREHPDSTLAMLSRQGVTYTDAHLVWDNEAAGLLAIATRGTPRSTHIPGDAWFDRKLSAANNDCSRTGGVVFVSFDSQGRRPLIAARDPARECKALQPHQLLADNTIFEVVRAQGGVTSWSGDDAGLVDLLRGPSGDGLTYAAVHAAGEGDSVLADMARMDDVRRWLNAPDKSTGERAAPELTGMNFSEFEEARRNGPASVSGRLPSLAAASLLRIDGSLGGLVAQLREQNTFAKTWFVITSTFGDPEDGLRFQRGDAEAIRTLVGTRAAYVLVEGTAMVWLRDRSLTERVAGEYATAKKRLHIGRILTGDDLELSVGEVSGDARLPNIVLEPAQGISWARKIPPGGTHAGMDEGAGHVALLVSGPQLTGRHDATPIPTTQIPAMVLRALGFEKLDLQALHREHSPALPGIF